MAYDLERWSVRWSHHGGAGFESVMAGDGRPGDAGHRRRPRLHTRRERRPDRARPRERLPSLRRRTCSPRTARGVRARGRVLAARRGRRRDRAGRRAGGRSLVAYDAGTGERRGPEATTRRRQLTPRGDLDGVRQVVVLSSTAWPDTTSNGRRALARSMAGARGEGVPARRPGRRPLLRVGGLRAWAAGWCRFPGARWQLARGPRLADATPEGEVHPGGRAPRIPRWPRRGRPRVPSTRKTASDGGRAAATATARSCWWTISVQVQARTARWCWSSRSPSGTSSSARFQAVEGRAWATPALAGDLLVVRGDVEAA